MGNHYMVIFLYSAFLKYFTDFFKAVKSCRLLFKVLTQFIPILPKYKVILLEKQNKTPCYDPRPSDRISILIKVVKSHQLQNPIFWSIQTRPLLVIWCPVPKFKIVGKSSETCSMRQLLPSQPSQGKKLSQNSSQSQKYLNQLPLSITITYDPRQNKFQGTTAINLSSSLNHHVH